MSKPSFTLSWFRNHKGHRVERYEAILPMHIAYAKNIKAVIGVKCFSCNSIYEYDTVSLLPFNVTA